MSVYICALYLFKYKKSTAVFNFHIEKSELELCQVIPDSITFDRSEYILKYG